MSNSSIQEQERPTALQPLARASSALLDRLFAPHGPSAYFKWVAPGSPGSHDAPAPVPVPPAPATADDDGPGPDAPATARSTEPAKARTTRRPTAPATDVPASGQVAFARSGLTAVAEGSLLETAEAAGLTPRYRCRRGICGTCTTPKLSGTVLDARTGEISDAAGPIRICVSVPQGDVALDL